MKNVNVPLDEQQDADLERVQAAVGPRFGKKKLPKPDTLKLGIALLLRRYVRAPKPTAAAAPEPEKDSQ